MNNPAIAAVVAFLLTSSLAATAHALSCGDGITTSVTLTSDLHCPSGFAAIEVYANNVTIDLNGYTLSGGSGMSGILLHGFTKLTVKNGSIRGFFAGVNANRTTSLTVRDVLFFDVGFGIASNAGNQALIENNQFVRAAQGISIRNSDSSTSANNNVINDNEIYQATIGINICGDRADANVITNNLIWRTTDYGINLIQSDGNKIIRNRILETGNTAIRLSKSSYADIASNTLREGRIGLNILPDAASSCLDKGSPRSYKNVVRGNYALEFQSGVELGLGAVTSSQVFVNTLVDNKLYDNDVGIFFHSDAHRNTTSNGFQGTTTPVIDHGVANTY